MITITLPDQTLNHLLTILENVIKARNVTNIIDDAEEIMYDERLNQMMVKLHKIRRELNVDFAGKPQRLFKRAWKEHDKLTKDEELRIRKAYLDRYKEACAVKAGAKRYRRAVRQSSARAEIYIAQHGVAQHGEKKLKGISKLGRTSFMQGKKSKGVLEHQVPVQVVQCGGNTITVHQGTPENPTVVAPAGSAIKDLPRAGTYVFFKPDVTPSSKHISSEEPSCKEKNGSLSKETKSSQLSEANYDDQFDPINPSSNAPPKENCSPLEDGLHEEITALIARTHAQDGDSDSIIAIIGRELSQCDDEEEEEDEFEDARSTLTCATHSTGWETISDETSTLNGGSVNEDQR